MPAIEAVAYLRKHNINGLVNLTDKTRLFVDTQRDHTILEVIGDETPALYMAVVRTHISLVNEIERFLR